MTLSLGRYMQNNRNLAAYLSPASSQNYCTRNQKFEVLGLHISRSITAYLQCINISDSWGVCLYFFFLFKYSFPYAVHLPSADSSLENNHMETWKSPSQKCQATSLCSFQMAKEPFVSISFTSL